MNLTATQLAKLTIDAYADIKFKQPTGIRWQALLNPTELSFSRKNLYQATQSAGTSAPQQSFSGGEPDQVQIDLLLDGTGVVGEPGSIGPLLDALLELTRFQGDTHQPYYVHAFWGRFGFRGILTQADVTYKLFDRAGEPLRATVKLSLKEALSAEETAAQDRPSSPDLYQTWLVEDGETLDAIAARVYGDPAYWRPLAAANRLANPRGLRTGQLLVLPPLAAGR
ncbi:CIS tube protein [Streptomyces spongiae]|uniref:CIS tube protein n=1 Tax=Streptomyces spongiae TaxID=565072 RepID=UPI00128CAD33|nr:LysM peptidoglycan-binding domain-containing protein [Streptomyces spongiae]